MPQIDTKGKTKIDKTLDPKTLDSVIELLELPKLSGVTDPAEKARISQKFFDLSKNMTTSKGASDQFSKSSVKFTDEQIAEAINNIKETDGKIDLTYIGWVALILILMYLISAGFSLIMGLVMSSVAQKTTMDLRREVELKLNTLPLKYFDMHPHGDILSRVTNDIDTISNTLQQSLTQVITSIITIIGFVVMMLTISPWLTLIVIATLPLYIVSTAFIAKKSQKYFAAQQKEIGLLSGHVEEMYSGHKIVKVFGQERRAFDKFKGINQNLYVAGWKAQFISGIMFPLMNFISNLGYVAIAIIGGIWITQGNLKIGDITAFIQYSRQFTMPIVQTANIANIIQSTVACAERVFEVLDEQEQLPDAANALVLAAPKGKVEFQDVAFRYVDDIPLIEGMNLTVNPGHTVAIVGPTGAGKTTLVNLLMRFYELNSGKISIDGVDITDIKRNELHMMFGMVLQDTWLFNGTIRDNIAYGKPNATEDEIVAAAKAAYADHFIRTLPEGYDTILNEEATNISQGQKQLLTIARAIMADPAILILDEATSSVDTRTEVLIQKAMAKLMKDRTSFVIAHRLSTIRDAETILVMNQGSIIEQGNHAQLLADAGFYADLYNSQFAGEVEESA
ncbi:MAG: ABC transporter ATP-binding protein [Clostridia bacterium]